jgi:metal-dependent amidase/aminoacylase/carboxypeptidase family protein
VKLKHIPLQALDSTRNLPPYKISPQFQPKMPRSEIYIFISSHIDECRSKLHSLNRYIYENPELRHEEFKAHDKLTAFLEGEGFTVTRRAHGLQTAFRAEFGTGSGRNVAINAEYDALPGFNTHACGHSRDLQ